MPADAGVDDGGARLFDFLRQLHDFIVGRAIGHEINHRQPVDHDEIGANGFADAFDHLDGQAHAVLVRAAPFVGAFVGVGDEELVEEVAL